MSGPMRRNDMPKVKMSRQEQMSGLGKLAGASKRYLPIILISTILILVSVVCSIVAPNYLSELTDAITAGAATKTIDMDKILNYTYILIGFYAAIAISSYISTYLVTGMTQDFAYDLRKQLSIKINKLPLAYFDGNQIGDILSRVTNDVDSLAQSLNSAINMVIQSILLLIGAVIGMFATSWQMALAAMISLPLMIIFLMILMKLAMPQFIKRQEEIGDVNGVVEEKFSGQLIINLFNAEEREDKAFEEKNQQLGATMFKAQFFGGLMMPIMSFISYAAYAAVMIVGGLLIAGNTAGITMGTISAFLVYVRLFQSPISQIAQALNTLQTAGAASKRVFDFLGEKELESEEGKERKLAVDGKEEIKGEVEFRHVNFSYDDTREIIHDFSATVKPGMKVAIVGPTGAGKTTMVNLLMRFYEINGGEILIDGVNIKDMPREEIHDIFGMVLQDTWVFEGTLRENLVYNTQNVEEESINEALDKANLTHFIKTLPGALDYYVSDPNSISGGQKQLLTISRAMLRQSPMMILDEATSNVDTRTEEQIQEAMDTLTKGKTSFVIAHRLSTIKNADLILVMKDGNIIETGTHDSLMAENGFYASLYNSQFAFE